MATNERSSNMKWGALISVLLTAFLAFSPMAHGSDEYSETIKVFKGSPLVKKFFGNSYGYAQVSAVAITAGAQAQAGSAGSSAGASGGSQSAGTQKASYHKGMAVFTKAIGGLMYEASVGGQKFSYEPLKK